LVEVVGAFDVGVGSGGRGGRRMNAEGARGRGGRRGRVPLGIGD
jgi:hypothetical protein